MPDFHDVRLPPDVERGATGGPGFSTTVVPSISGHETRNINWSSSRSQWEVSYGIQDKTDFNEVLRFFYARRGKAHGFRFKDHSDFEATFGETQCIGVTSGLLLADNIETQWQMQKEYEQSGPDPYVKVITRPVAGSGQQAKGLLTATANFTDGETITIDSTTYTFESGTLNVAFEVALGAFLVNSLDNLVAAIHASGTPGVEYAAGTTAHSTVITRGNSATQVWLVAITSGTDGNFLDTTETCVNASFGATTLTGGTDATNLDAAPIVVQVNSSIADPADYTIDYSTGIITFTFAPATGPINWSGEFDFPVRFDIDLLSVEMQTQRAGSIQSLPIVEIREGETVEIQDVETGSWVPTLAGDSVAGVQTYSTQFGRFVRHGNEVRATGVIVLTAKDAATAGALEVRGLPFTAKNITNYFQVPCFGAWNFNLTAGYTQVAGFIAPNTTRMPLRQSGDNLATAALDAAVALATTLLLFTITYERE